MDKELEEAKEILEDICKTQTQVYRNINGKLEVVKPAYINAIETVLQALKENQRQVEYDKTHILTPETVTLNYIPKKKVEDKIEELNDIKSEYSQRVIHSKTSTFTELAQEILKELLEDK